MALKRTVRLRKSSDFQRVRQQGRNITSRLLNLAWAQNTVETLRIGFVISKRISKHAVTRNYIKRVLSEAIRPYLADLPQGCDVVISARTQIIQSDGKKQQVASSSVITLELASLLRRTRLLASAHQAPETSGEDRQRSQFS